MIIFPFRRQLLAVPAPHIVRSKCRILLVSSKMGNVCFTLYPTNECVTNLVCIHSIQMKVIVGNLKFAEIEAFTPLNNTFSYIDKDFIRSNHSLLMLNTKTNTNTKSLALYSSIVEGNETTRPSDWIEYSDHIWWKVLSAPWPFNIFLHFDVVCKQTP